MKQVFEQLWSWILSPTGYLFCGIVIGIGVIGILYLITREPRLPKELTEGRPEPPD